MRLAVEKGKSPSRAASERSYDRVPCVPAATPIHAHFLSTAASVAVVIAGTASPIHRDARAKIGADLRKRDVHDGDVELDDDEAEARRGDHPTEGDVRVGRSACRHVGRKTTDEARSRARLALRPQVGRGGKHCARHAGKGGAHEFPSPLLTLHPRSHLPGRIVPNVLRVSTLQLRDPVLLVVLMKGDDTARYRRAIGDHSLHRST